MTLTALGLAIGLGIAAALWVSIVALACMFAGLIRTVWRDE